MKQYIVVTIENWNKVKVVCFISATTLKHATTKFAKAIEKKQILVEFNGFEILEVSTIPTI